MHAGKVEKIVPARDGRPGFGFIRPNDGNGLENVFFSLNTLDEAELKAIEVAAIVSYRPHRDRLNRPQALDIRVLGSADSQKR
jgi:cold shock CspA family protein